VTAATARTPSLYCCLALDWLGIMSQPVSAVFPGGVAASMYAPYLTVSLVLQLPCMHRISPYLHADLLQLPSPCATRPLPYTCTNHAPALTRANMRALIKPPSRARRPRHSDKTVGLSVGRVILQGRQAKGLTQKELATSINEKPQVSYGMLFSSRPARDHGHLIVSPCYFPLIGDC